MPKTNPSPGMRHSIIPAMPHSNDAEPGAGRSGGIGAERCASFGISGTTANGASFDDGRGEPAAETIGMPVTGVESDGVIGAESIRGGARSDSEKSDRSCECLAKNRPAIFIAMVE